MLKDKFGRVITYLRVSVTQRCNFRCQYCMPKIPFNHTPKEDILSYEEMMSFIKVAIDSGINKIRLTGGEPLIRKDLDRLVMMIKSYKSSVKVYMTSNAVLLKGQAKKLKDAGLDGINVSLDTTKPEVFFKITQKDMLPKVLEGIDEAIKVGIEVKFNAVVMQGYNERDIVDLIDYAKDKNCVIRFIEYMENSSANKELKVLNSDYILGEVSKKYNYKPLGFMESSPAQRYRLDDGYEFGIIEPHKDDFCKYCNRIRVTAEGDLISCLYFDDTLSLKKAIKSGKRDEIEKVLHTLIENKHEKNNWTNNECNEISDRAFYKTGG